MQTKQYHVVTASGGGWLIRAAGAATPLGHFATKAEAVRKAREICKMEKAELVIHRKDGTIQRSDSHGNDPFPPRDRDTH